MNNIWSRPITMSVMTPTHSFRHVPNHYELNAHGRFAWLHRLLWRALHKLRALKLGMGEVTTYKTVTIDGDSVADRIMAAQYALRGVAADNVSRVFIGPKEMAELTRQASFEDFAMSPKSTEFRFRGLTVEVVPHMQGVLVL